VSTSGRIITRLLPGRALRADRPGESLLPKRITVPVFSSDARTSVIDAPDEIFLTLAVAGGFFGTTNSWQIGLAVVLVMLVAVASGRQNLHAYPSGGDDHEVASVTLGPRAGLTVASALLTDHACPSQGVEEGFERAGAGWVRRPA
jgi:hypothetical protein